MSHCASCGTILDPDNRFCTNCGNAVSETNTSSIKNGEVKDRHLERNNQSAERLRMDTVGWTIIGLITFGIWWAFKLKKWSELHLKYYEDNFSDSKGEKYSEILSAVNQSTSRTVQLAIITVVLLSIGLLTLITSFFWEVVFDIGGFPLPEGPFWFFCWISLSMLAVTWASVLFGILKVLELQSSNWLPLNGSSGIILTTIIWCVLALGLLPLLIFPPIAAGSVNKYVSTLSG